MKQQFYSKVDSLKLAYPVGTRVEMEFMDGDPNPIASGEKGTVIGVDDIGTIHVRWDCGRTLGVISGIDHFRVIHEEENTGKN